MAPNIDFFDEYTWIFSGDCRQNQFSIEIRDKADFEGTRKRKIILIVLLTFIIVANNSCLQLHIPADRWHVGVNNKNLLIVVLRSHSSLIDRISTSMQFDGYDHGTRLPSHFLVYLRDILFRKFRSLQNNKLQNLAHN